MHVLTEEHWTKHQIRRLDLNEEPMSPRKEKESVILLDVKHTSLDHPQGFFRRIRSGLDVLAQLYVVYIGEDSLKCRLDVGSVERGSFYKLHAVFRCTMGVGKLESFEVSF